MFSKKKIYLDHNSTTPVDPRVVDVMLPFFTERFGNSSSDHIFGWEGSEAVEYSREQIASLLNCKPTGITFTSGATEAANLGLFGFCKANRKKGDHIISCKTEHKAILDTLGALEREGFKVTYLDVNTEGSIDLGELEKAITAETILVCLMLANNETGMIHPMQQISDIAHKSGAKLMSDITQAVGKIPVDLQKLNLDIAIFSSHKIYGPKGVGAIYINRKNKIKIEPQLFGGGQERGLRPGTLNVPGIVGFGKAAELASYEMIEEHKRISGLRDELEQQLLHIEGCRINSGQVDRLPNTTNITFKNIDGNQLLRKLNTLAVSRGSACTSNTIQPSHVLRTMGLSDELALSSLRISLGKNTTISEIVFAVEELKNTVNHLKREAV